MMPPRLLRRFRPPRAALPALALLALLGSTTPAVRADIGRAAYLQLAHSVARVEVRRQHGGVAVGSGVTVARGIVVTNCHVTRDALAIRLAGRGIKADAVDQSVDAEHDLCFLRAPEWTGEAVPIGLARTVSLGERVVAIGYTGGPAAILREGQVRGLHAQDGAPVIESSSFFSSGASGGGLFDREGELIGVLTFRSRGDDPFFYSVPAEWITRGLARAARDEQPWQPVGPLREGLAFWEQGLERLPYFLRIGILEEAGHWEAVIHICRLWAASDARNPAPYVARGRSYRRLGYALAARQALYAALRRAPDDVSAWYAIGQLELDQGNADGARRVAERLAALDENHADRLRRAVADAIR